MSAALDRLHQPDKPVVSCLKGPKCPACGGYPHDLGLYFQAGLHQDPIVQCWYCQARIFVGLDGFRAAIPESKAPPIRPDFLTPRKFDATLDSINRQIADFEGSRLEFERRSAWYADQVRQLRAKARAHFGLADSSAIVAGVQQSEVGAPAKKEEVANRSGGA